jgi:hypothetical protein
MPSRSPVLYQNHTLPRLNIPAFDSRHEKENEYFVCREYLPLPSLSMQRHAIYTRFSNPSIDSHILQWGKTVSNEAYPFNPDTIPATYPEEWLHEELVRLRSPPLELPTDDWVATTAETRAKMNVTSAGNMEVLAQLLQTLPERLVLCGIYNEKWKEALQEAVMCMNEEAKRETDSGKSVEV